MGQTLRGWSKHHNITHITKQHNAHNTTRPSYDIWCQKYVLQAFCSVFALWVLAISSKTDRHLQPSKCCYSETKWHRVLWLFIFWWVRAWITIVCTFNIVSFVRIIVLFVMVVLKWPLVASVCRVILGWMSPSKIWALKSPGQILDEISYDIVHKKCICFIIRGRMSVSFWHGGKLSVLLLGVTVNVQLPTVNKHKQLPNTWTIKMGLEVFV